MKCKKCKKELEYATYSQELVQFGEIELSSGKHETPRDEDFKGSEYFCPFCDEDITDEVNKII